MQTILGYTMASCLVLTCCGGLATALSGTVRLPMEVFGSNTTSHDAHHNATSLETRKAVLRQKVLLMSSYGSADGSGVQPAGLDRLEEQLEGAGALRAAQTVHGARILYQIGVSAKIYLLDRWATHTHQITCITLGGHVYYTAYNHIIADICNVVECHPLDMPMIWRRSRAQVSRAGVMSRHDAHSEGGEASPWFTYVYCGLPADCGVRKPLIVGGVSVMLTACCKDW